MLSSSSTLLKKDWKFINILRLVISYLIIATPISFLLNCNNDKMEILFNGSRFNIIENHLNYTVGSDFTEVPVDIIMTIDNSNSMTDEIDAVRTYI